MKTLVTRAMLLAFVAVSLPALAADKKGAAPAKADAKAAEKTAEAKVDPAHDASKADPPLLHVGDDAPMFNGLLHNPEEAGKPTIDLSAMVGGDAEADGTKVVLISFFATWCGPCKRELPLLVQLDKELRESGLRVVSIAIDKDEAKWPEIARLVKENKITFPVVKDRYNLIARRFLGEKTALPSVFLIGRDGLVKLVKQGYGENAETFLRGEIDKALKE
ncbi:MAG: TlpA family protein disulfide reductase [Deltaproteobacteria bacterium]|nr:TlpA family protein disulfide reductase [Deltaproteobacteria bacterium]